MITRFAPSPTGYLHLGHAAAAVKAFGFSKSHDGQCLLRIEDIDHTRCRQKYTAAIYEDLSWLGFDWPKPARIQSEHLSAYADTLENLKARGLAYACFKSRKELALSGASAPLSEDEVQSRITDGETPAWRLSLTVAREILGVKIGALSYREHGKIQTTNVDFGDVILARKDIGISYHLACCHDDAAQNITDIVRGSDLAEQTGVHVLLQNLMGWPTPRYHHHGLILRGDGQKLSKRTGGAAIRELRGAGMTPKAVLDMAKAGICG
ncbi:MAG: tRNA glutamyl-Q(34) synthetase GluQRS [Robiginitomaculum sp.]